MKRTAYRIPPTGAPTPPRPGTAKLAVTRPRRACALVSPAMRSLLLAALFVAVLAPAAMASQADSPMVVAFTEAEGEVEEPPSTTVVSEGGIAPAELAPPAEDAEAEDQWTAKFLAPTVAILGVLGIIAAFAFYGLRVRGRYRVAE